MNRFLERVKYRIAAPAVAVVILAGCGGGGGDEAGSNHGNEAPNGSVHVVLYAASSVPAGEQCERGGTRYDSGADTNDDGVLDAAEITFSRFVCDGNNSGPPNEADKDSHAEGQGLTSGKPARRQQVGFTKQRRNRK